MATESRSQRQAPINTWPSSQPPCVQSRLASPPLSYILPSKTHHVCSELSHDGSQSKTHRHQSHAHETASSPHICPGPPRTNLPGPRLRGRDLETQTITKLHRHPFGHRDKLRTRRIDLKTGRLKSPSQRDGERAAGPSGPWSPRSFARRNSVKQ